MSFYPKHDDRLTAWRSARSSPRCSQAPRRDLRHPAEAPAVVPVSTSPWDQAVLAPLSRSDVRYFTSAAIPRTSSATTSKPQRRRCHVGEFYLSIESVCRRPSGTKATPYAGAHRSFGFVPISAKVSADIGPIRAHRQGSLHAPPQISSPNHEGKSRDLKEIDYSNPAACPACPLRSPWTTDHRRVSRLENEAVLDRIDAPLKALGQATGR